MSETPPDQRPDPGLPDPRTDPEVVLAQRELRNSSRAIMRGLERGQRYLITSNGTPVGELAPRHRRHFTPRALVVGTFAALPEEPAISPLTLAELADLVEIVSL